MNNICQVVVTYNRKELLFRNICSVLKQSCESDILIFDNNSSDGTYDFLKQKGIIDNNRIRYYRSTENLGGAGGFSAGMKKAYELGYDFFWLMDDDGYCLDGDTLKNLLTFAPKDTNEFILNSTVVCEKDYTLTFGFQDIYTYNELLQQSKNGVYEGYINPFNSTLISRECVEKIGFPKAEFFIYGDEHEYMLRALKNGIRLLTVVSSLYYHPVNRKIEYRKSWRYDIPMKDEPVWKTFCDVRNNIYITKEYEGWKMLLIKIYVYVVAAMMKKEHKCKYLQYTLLGIVDGLRSNFARPIMFSK